MHSLESELTQTLYNHKLFLEEVQQIEEERNFYYQKLRAIEEQCTQAGKAGTFKPIRNEVMSILSQTPEDFCQPV